MATKWAARKRAQRALPDLSKETCCKCGSTKHLQRHHPDYSELDRFEVLCRACHAKADQRDGYRRTRPEAACVICGQTFTPKCSHPHKTCGEACLSELGRRNAMKRWSSKPSSGRRTSTDCEPSETPSSRKSFRSSGKRS